MASIITSGRLYYLQTVWLSKLHVWHQTNLQVQLLRQEGTSGATLQNKCYWNVYNASLAGEIDTMLEHGFNQSKITCVTCVVVLNYDSVFFSLKKMCSRILIAIHGSDVFFCGPRVIGSTHSCHLLSASLYTPQNILVANISGLVGRSNICTFFESQSNLMMSRNNRALTYLYSPSHPSWPHNSTK